MKIIRKIAVLLLPFLLFGCATVIDPASLKQVSSRKAIDLPNGFVHVGAPGGIYDTQFKVELLAGPYVAELENDAGTYFRGPPGCMQGSIAASTNKDQPINKATKNDGGIFLPKNASEPARIYRYLKHTTQPTIGRDVTVNGLTQDAAPHASIGQAAVGQAIGLGIVDYLIESERGKIVLGKAYDSLNAAIVFPKNN